MTTLEQQVAHLKDYWNVPQDDIDLLIKLGVQDYFIKQENKKKELWDTFINKIKEANTQGNYSEETNWGKPVGEEVW